MSINRRIERAAKQAIKQADYIKSCVHEVYAIHHIMHAGNVAPEQIFIEIANVGNATIPGLYITVFARRGVTEFRIHVRPITKTQIDAFESAWREFCVLQPQLPKQFLDDLVHQTASYQINKTDILTGLALKGISGPLADSTQSN